MAGGFIAALPNLILAFIIFIIFYFVARRIRSLVTQMTEKQHRAKNFALLLGKTAQTSVVIAGLLVTMTILFPSFRPSDIIQLLAIDSVAISFDFHELFQHIPA